MSRHKGDGTRVKKVKDARTKAWTAMHVLRTFTLPELVMTSGIGMANAQKYILRLQEFGFVRKAQQLANGQPGNFDVWQLVRHSGPDAPIARKNGTVYDPNTQKTYGALV